MKNLSEDVKKLLVEARIEGKTYKQLGEMFHISAVGAKKIYDKYLVQGTVANLKKSGRKRKTTIQEDRLIRREAVKDPKTSSRKINESLNLCVSNRTIRRRLKSFGLQSFICKKKPLLRKVNIQKRLAFAKQYVNMPIDYWKRVVWTDESKFEIKNTKRRDRVWCESSQRLQIRYTQPTVKHGGGNIMVWGAFSFNGVGNLAKIDEKLTGLGYVDLLKENLKPSLRKMRLRRYVFVQDNDPKHTSKVASAFFQQQYIEKLDWPPQSPDLNPIENLWAILDAKIPLEGRTNRQIFWERLQEEWNAISQLTIDNLIKSIPNRLQMVIDNKGGHTKY